jgi:hypothetical protein
MDPEALLVALGHLVFFLACAVLGGRLLAMARRTRQAPELFVGLALAGLALPTPVMIAGGFGRGTVGELSWPLMGLGFAALLAATVFLFAFTWKTFRPDVGWAKALVLAGGLAQAIVVAGTFFALRAADPGTTADIVAAPGWLLAIRGPLAVSFGWTTLEAFHAYTMSRRRLALGLGDAIAGNRMLLWAWVGLVSTLNNIVNGWLQALGKSAMADPLVAASNALGAVVPVVLMWLVFMPPRAYLERVTRRTAA